MFLSFTIRTVVASSFVLLGCGGDDGNIATDAAPIPIDSAPPDRIPPSADNRRGIFVLGEVEVLGFFGQLESFVHVSFNNTADYTPPPLGTCTTESFVVPATVDESTIANRVPPEIDEGPFSVVGTSHLNLSCEFNPFAGLQIPDPAPTGPPRIELEGKYVCGGGIEVAGGPFIRDGDEFTSGAGLSTGTMVLGNRVVDTLMFNPVKSSLVMTGMGPPTRVSFLPLEVTGVTVDETTTTVGVSNFLLGPIDTDTTGPIVRDSPNSTASFNIGNTASPPYDFLDGDLTIIKNASARIEAQETTVSPPGEGFSLDISSSIINALPLADPEASLLFSCDDLANGGNCGAVGADASGEDVFFVMIEASDGFHPGGPMLAIPKTAGRNYARMVCALPVDSDITIPATEWAKIVAIQPAFARTIILRASQKTTANADGFNETTILIGHGVDGASPPFPPPNPPPT